jgi:hypothetical protein
MEDDDRQVYLTKASWDVLERLEELGFCRPRERLVLLRIAIAVAMARGLEADPEEIKGRDSHYQLDVLDPLRYAIKWRYPEETRPFFKMSNLAHAGCMYLRDHAQELDGNVPLIEIITQSEDLDFIPWARVEGVPSGDDQDLI